MHTRLREVQLKLRRDADRPGELARRWAGLGVTLSFLLVVYATVFPFNFKVPPGMTLRQAAMPFDLRPYDPSDLADTWQNILLFLPFGFALGCMIRAINWRNRWIVPFATGIALLLSATVESLQEWLPTRDPAVADILSNTTGGLLGSLLFLAVGTPVLKAADTALVWLRRFLSLPVLATLFIVLCLLTLRSPLHMRHRGLALANWSDAFPLTLGNIPVDDRYWHGRVHRVEIASRAPSPDQLQQAYAAADLRDVLGDSVLASYRLDDSPQPASDLTHHSPVLQPTQGEAPWTISDGPMATLSRAIAHNDQFTLRASFTASQAFQTGLARILTLSPDAHRCNIMLAQEGYDLVLRVRTILTGDNGTNPAWYVSNLFLKPGPHQLLIAYSDPRLRLLVDGSRSFTVDVPSDFGGTARYLARPMTLPLYGFGLNIFRALFYLINFAPLGVLLGFVAVDPRVTPLARRITLITGVLLPCVLMQVVVVGICRRDLRADNLLYGILVPLLIGLVGSWWLRRHAPNPLYIPKVDLTDASGR